jgi:hypothetical protein
MNRVGLRCPGSAPHLVVGYASAALQRATIHDPHRSRPGEFDHSALLEMGKRTTDGLDGQPEIVRDIVAGGWQDHAIIGAT